MTVSANCRLAPSKHRSPVLLSSTTFHITPRESQSCENVTAGQEEGDLVLTFVHQSKNVFACCRMPLYTCAGITGVGDGRIRRGGWLAFEVASNGGGLSADGARVAGELGGPEVTT